jgi:hypothetical protein
MALIPFRLNPVCPHEFLQMADSGEDISADSPVILQHVVSGMVLVCIRHLPALDSCKATNSEEYLSDDDEVDNSLEDDDEKHIIQKRDELDKWVQTIRSSVDSVLEYCKMDILPTDPQNPSKLGDLCNEDKLHGAPFHCEDESNEAASASFKNDMLEFEEYRKAAEDSLKDKHDDISSLVELWNYRGETLSSTLKDTGKFLFEEDDLTVESIKIKALEIEYELSAWFRMPAFFYSGGYIRAIEIVDFALKAHEVEDVSDHPSQIGSRVSMNGGASVSGTSAYTASARMGSENHVTSSVASVPDSKVVRGTRSVVSTTGSRCDTASLILNDKDAKHPLQTLDMIIALFKERDKKGNISASENPWTMHMMTPKRLRYFRAKFEDRFSLDTNSQGIKENTSKFLMACRWSFSTRHDKSERKEDEDVNVSNNTLFAVEAYDCEDSIVVLGSELSKDSSLSASTTKCANISMVQLGAAPEKKSHFFESPALQQFEQQLCNIEFVSPKNAAKIRNGAQVSSIIRNFCSHLKYATDKRDLSQSDLEYFMAFVRRYNSRLQEAFDVVTRSCLIDGFEPGAASDEVDNQSQLFFGSLGIVELSFSVIQVGFVFIFSSCLLSVIDASCSLLRNSLDGKLRRILHFSPIGKCARIMQKFCTTVWKQYQVNLTLHLIAHVMLI